MSGQFTALPLSSPVKEPLYPLNRSLGAPRTGLDDVKGRKILPLPGLELQPLSRSAHSQLLYRLHYSLLVSACLKHFRFTSVFGNLGIFFVTGQYTTTEMKS
jgi:hypothetical protein